MSCKNNSKKQYEDKKETSVEDLSMLGDSIAQIAQMELLKNVRGAMKEEGPVKAIKFCNLNASQLMVDLSKKHNCKISRISIKNRSPNNYPSSQDEINIVNRFAEVDIADSVSKLIKSNNKTIYYKPIYTTMPACLKCHGNAGSNISEKTQNVLNELYPKDLAIGYALNDFRGAWKIEFE